MTILRYVLFGLALLIAAAIGWRSTGGMGAFILAHPPAGILHSLLSGIPASVSPAAPASPPYLAPSMPPALPDDRPAAARASVLASAASIPTFAAFYKALAMSFPHVHEGMIERAAKATAAGAPPPSAGTLIWDALRDLQQSNGILAAKADEHELGLFFDARLAMLDSLADVDPRGCADFVYGTVDPSIEDFSTVHHDLVADMAAKELAAIVNGQRNHVDATPPEPKDLDLVAEGLAARHLNADEIAMLLDGKPIAPPLPDARICDIGRTYLSVLKGLPAEVRHRIYGFTAELLARS